METDPSIQAIKDAWLRQEPEILSVQVTTVRSASDRFDRKVLRRNQREYIACIIVAILFAGVGWRAHGWMTPVGSLMVIAAAGYIAWHLHRHGAAGKWQPDTAAQSLAHYHRGELVRQRDLLRSIWRWYIGPMVPGVLFLILGRWFQDHVAGRTIAADHRAILMSSVFVAVVFIGAGWLNIRGANKIQKRIDELDQLLGE